MVKILWESLKVGLDREWFNHEHYWEDNSDAKIMRRIINNNENGKLIQTKHLYSCFVFQFPKVNFQGKYLRKLVGLVAQVDVRLHQMSWKWEDQEKC